MTEPVASENSGLRNDQPETKVEWFPAADERLRVTRIIARSRADVEQALRVRPDRLVRIAYGADVNDTGNAIISLFPIKSQRWLRVPARIEFSTPLQHKGAIISLKWQSMRFSRYFPAFEADLALQPEARATELVLDGTYRPPLGIVGLIFDYYIGKRVASAVAVGFVEALSTAIETDEFTATTQG